MKRELFTSKYRLLSSRSSGEIFAGDVQSGAVELTDEDVEIVWRVLRDCMLEPTDDVCVVQRRANLGTW